MNSFRSTPQKAIQNGRACPRSSFILVFFPPPSCPPPPATTFSTATVSLSSFFFFFFERPRGKKLTPSLSSHLRPSHFLLVLGRPRTRQSRLRRPLNDRTATTSKSSLLPPLPTYVLVNTIVCGPYV